MDIEVISKVEGLPSGELILILRSGGNPQYQYVYRGAAAVYWDAELGGFKSAGRKEWSCLQWFEHIRAAVETELGVGLELAVDASWINIPLAERKSIEARYAV